MRQVHEGQPPVDPEKLQKVTREALWNFYQVHDTTKPAAGIEIIFKKFEENPAALIEGLKKKYDATIELEPVFPEERYTKLFLLALLLAKPIQMHHAHSLMLSVKAKLWTSCWRNMRKQGR
jgi:hypothetical protein